MGLAIVSWTAADIFWTAVYADDANPPYPSIADALWLVFYPASWVTLFLLVRSRMRNARASLWLDGLIGAVGVGGARRGPRLRHRRAPGRRRRPRRRGADQPRLPGRRPDCCSGVIVAIFGLSGWRPGPRLARARRRARPQRGRRRPLPVQTADGTYAGGRASWTRSGPPPRCWSGCRAWQPAKHARAPRDQSLRVVIVPVVCGLLAVVLLAYDHFSRLERAHGHAGRRDAAARARPHGAAVRREPAACSLTAARRPSRTR